MIDINLVRAEPEKVRQGIIKKQGDPKLVDRFLEVDTKWRATTGMLDALRAEKNLLKPTDRERGKEIKEKTKVLEEESKTLEKERDLVLEQIPNVPSDDTPVGKDETENVVLRKVGEIKKFDFEAKDYLSLAGPMIDTEIAGQVSGSRFGYIFGDLVLLEFALVKLVFDKLLPKGFIPVVPPVMVKPDVMKGMGKSKFIGGDDAFYLPKDDLYLVGSSEHSIGPLNMGAMLDPKKLPMRYLGFSTCFRREAGSYGKDTKGILRVHQFDKLEMFSITTPEESDNEHKFLLSCEEELMQALGIPYQVLSLCTGDMGFENRKQYDIEAWMPGQNKYRETHSCSNTSDYQSRGLNIRYRSKAGDKPEFVHMLNGTAFAIGRIIIAILENYQNADGSVTVPEVLRAYVGKEKIGPMA